MIAPSDYLFDSKGRRIPRPNYPPTRTAPGRLEPLREFLNTVNLHNDADLLGTVAGLRTWLVGRSLPTSGLSAAVLADVHSLRQALRDLTLANVNTTSADAAWTALDTLAAQYPVRITFAGGVRLRSLRPGIGVFIAEMLATVAAARADGTWTLLKMCRDPTCRWVVYDRTKNRSTSWCSGTDCGAKARARTYRARSRV